MRENRPQAIISSNTLLPHISSWLQAKGLRVPRDIGVLNLNTPSSGNQSGVSQDAPATGAAAARLLIEKLNHNERGITESRVTLLTEGRWFEGKTLARLPEHKTRRRR